MGNTGMFSTPNLTFWSSAALARVLSDSLWIARTFSGKCIPRGEKWPGWMHTASALYVAAISTVSEIWDRDSARIALFNDMIFKSEKGAWKLTLQS